jgi:hypothetical protein
VTDDLTIESHDVKGNQTVDVPLIQVRNDTGVNETMVTSFPADVTTAPYRTKEWERGGDDVEATTISVSDPCADADPCLNEGVCYFNAEEGEIACLCGRGFAGRLCEVSVTSGDDPCLQYNPCVNGATCVLDQRTHEVACTCREGYTGKSCNE